jgi:hypothetical protein
MSQLRTLIWLKWRLLRNSLRSSKAVVIRVASILGMAIALAFALVLALVLGVVAYTLTQPEGLGSALHRTATRDVPESLSTEFIFFSIFGVVYLMWATVPLSLGGGKQFEAGKLLMSILSASLRRYIPCSSCRQSWRCASEQDLVPANSG